MKTILRTQQMFIDLPTPGSEPWLNIIVQRVEMDDTLTQVLNVVDRWGQVNARISAIAARTYPHTDPLCEVGQISVIGIATALTTCVIELIMQRYGGTFDPATGFIVLE